MNSPTTLDGRVALVTGSAKRIGRAIAERLHGAGARIAIHYRRSADEARAFAESLNAKRPGSAQPIAADLGSTADLTALAEHVLGWAKRLDILVNNASSFYPTPIGSIAEDDWNELINSNFKGPLFLTQACLPALKAAGGSIVNIVDIHGQNPLRHHHVYSPAKAALAMLTRCLAKDLGPEVRVNGVAPGAILWPSEGEPAEDKATIVDAIPLKRAGAPEDVAGCVLYLVRDAGYVNGQILAVDGGRSAGW